MMWPPVKMSLTPLVYILSLNNKSSFLFVLQKQFLHIHNGYLRVEIPVTFNKIPHEGHLLGVTQCPLGWLHGLFHLQQQTTL